MPPIKKQESPAPTPRAAALSQSASRHSAAATSTWQSIAAKSARLAPGAARGPVAASLVPPAAPRPSRLAEQAQQAAPLVAPAEKPETKRQVGWREVDRAVSVRTKRKYNLFGFRFGPKVSVFETEKVKLPVYQEADREKRYYAVVKAEELDQVKREGLQPATISSHRQAAPLTVEQLNTKGYLQFFTSEAAAYRYARAADAADYVVVPFLMPEYQDFTPDLARAAPGKEADVSHAMHTPHAVPPEFITKAH